MGVVLYPLMSEKSIQGIERDNRLVFVVDKRASKPEIKNEIEKLYNVKITKINTVIDRKGKKKAFVTLSEKTPATELATKLNMI